MKSSNRFRIGKLVLPSRYKLVGLLGVGNHSTVYGALDLNRRGTLVALKVARFNLQQTELLSFKQEFEILAQVTHPNIVPVYDFGVLPGSAIPYFTSGLIHGGTLSDYIAVADLKLIRTVLSNILEALDYVHSRGVLHLDIKPSNILITQKSPQRALLTDFGLAALLGSSNPSVHSSNTFSAPEIRQPDILDERADLFSLGASLLYVLTGQHAARHALNDWRGIWSTRLHRVPKSLRKVLLRAVEPYSFNRYASASEMLADTRHRLSLNPSTKRNSPSRSPFAGTQADLLNWRLMSHPAGVLLIRGEQGSGRSYQLHRLKNQLQLNGYRTFHITADKTNYGDYWSCTFPSSTLEHSEDIRRTLISQATRHMLSEARKQPLAVLVDDFGRQTQFIRDWIFSLWQECESLSPSPSALRPALIIALTSDEDKSKHLLKVDQQVDLIPLKTVDAVYHFTVHELGIRNLGYRECEYLRWLSNGHRGRLTLAARLMAGRIHTTLPHGKPRYSSPSSQLQESATLLKLARFHFKTMTFTQQTILSYLALSKQGLSRAILTRLIAETHAGSMPDSSALRKLGIMHARFYPEPLFSINPFFRDIVSKLIDKTRQRTLRKAIIKAVLAHPQSCKDSSFWPELELAHQFAHLKNPREVVHWSLRAASRAKARNMLHLMIENWQTSLSFSRYSSTSAKTAIRRRLAPALALLGQCKQAAHEYEWLASAYKKEHQLFKSFDARLKSAALYKDIGEYKKAQFVLSGDPALNRNPSFRLRRFSLEAPLLLRKGENAEIVNLGRRLIKNNGLRENIDLAFVRCDMGQALVNLERFNEARLHLQWVRRISRKHRWTVLLAKATMRLAVVLKRSNRHRQAIQLYREALQQCRTTGHLRSQIIIETNIGIIQRWIGQFNQSLGSLERAFSLAQKFSLPIQLAFSAKALADLMYFFGRYREAQEYGTLALSIGNRHSDTIIQLAALGTLAEIHLEEGHLGEANNFIKQGLRLSLKTDLLRQQRIFRKLLAVSKQIADNNGPIVQSLLGIPDGTLPDLSDNNFISLKGLQSTKQLRTLTDQIVANIRRNRSKALQDPITLQAGWWALEIGWGRSQRDKIWLRNLIRILFNKLLASVPEAFRTSFKARRCFSKMHSLFESSSSKTA